jgi:hypothetical protein
VPTAVSPLPTPVSPLPTPPATGSWRGNLAGYKFDGTTITSTTGGAILWNQAYGRDQLVSVRIKQLDRQSNKLGLVLLSQSADSIGDGAVEVEYVPRLGVMRIWMLADGRWFRIGDDYEVALGSGDRLAAQVVADTLTVVVNGSVVFWRVLDPWRFDPTPGGYTGLTSDGGTNVFGEFRGGTLTQ